MTLVEQLFDADLEKEEDRYAARETISALLRPWFAARTLSEVREALNAAGACWGPYQTFTQAVHEDPRISTENPMFQEIDQPGVGRFLAAGSMLDRSEEHTSELQSLMRISYAVFCLKKKIIS